MTKTTKEMSVSILVKRMWVGVVCQSCAKSQDGEVSLHHNSGGGYKRSLRQIEKYRNSAIFCPHVADGYRTGIYSQL